MTAFIFDNFISTTLAGNITSGSTTITLANSTGLPSVIPAGCYLAFILNDAATRTIYEIVYAVPQTITGATLTVIRGQEGTAALSWGVGDYLYSSPTAGQMAAFSQVAVIVPTTDITITPSAFITRVIAPAATAAFTIILEAGSIFGQEVTIYGVTNPITVTSVVSSPNEPYFVPPDGTNVWSIVVPGLNYGAQACFVWDDVNWRVTTAGQQIVSPAVAANQAVSLGQFGVTAGGAGSLSLPGGIIFKWGTVISTGVGGTTVTFPVAFPNNCFNVNATNASGMAAPTSWPGVGDISAASFFVIQSSASGTARDGSVYWLAVGN